MERAKNCTFRYDLAQPTPFDQHQRTKTAVLHCVKKSEVLNFFHLYDGVLGIDLQGHLTANKILIKTPRFRPWCCGKNLTFRHNLIYNTKTADAVLQN